MKIEKGKPLSGLTTFRIGGVARFFCVVKDRDDLAEAFTFAKKEGLSVFILGGGSNILISDKGFDGLVVKMEIRGIENTKYKIEDTKSIFIRAGAGENWDDFVKWTVEHGYGGLENLSLIPGSVGAAPVQNIGAYGAEVSSFIEEVEVFDTADSSFKALSDERCGFSYRNSIFKIEKGRYVITHVTFKLNKDRRTDISYKDLKEYFEGKSRPSIALVREAVITIRTAKLPDIRRVGTAGSFFKNPIVSKEKFAELKEKYPGLPSFPQGDGRFKIPIAWIIDHVCGLKGKSFGKAGIHDKQALVIVNNGGATSVDVERVASEVENAVREKTGLEIEREVVMVV